MRSDRVTVVIALGVVVACGVASAHAQTTRDAAACSTLMQLQIPGLALSITKAEWFPAGSTPPAGGPAAPASTLKLPAYCRLDGVLDRRTGSDGKTYGIGFALALPGEWNGRFLFQGGGGLNGSVQLPLGATAAGSMPALVRGFAVVSTDTGHTGTGFDASFMREQQASLDFAYQAVGRVALLARQIIAQHYARPPDHSYFAGCSTGGREGMLMVQRYPTYFDGVISGAPAMRTNFSGIGDQWVATMINQVAPKDAAGKAQTRQALSDADKKAVIDGVLDACDAGDGIKDGMIFNTKACRFDPKTLVCSGAKADGCLSPAQATALEKAFAGPKDSKGRQVYPGFFFDTGIAATQGIPGLLQGGSNPVGPPFSATEIDVDRLADAAASDPGGILTATSSWIDLNTFSKHGGKLLFFHGNSDPWFSALDTIDYYERMTKANGGAERVRNWSRLYLSPGMGHCGGGSGALDSFDLLTAMVDWVEKGVPPDSVTAAGRAFPGRSRPLCSYPQHAHYKGQGDSQDARNFECRD
ncbi:MAG TPA: tannase/feruloyl esterase family alpha/beta hydrolase [Vicinamibacterales bacterium]